MVLEERKEDNKGIDQPQPPELRASSTPLRSDEIGSLPHDVRCDTGNSVSIAVGLPVSPEDGPSFDSYGCSSILEHLVQEAYFPSEYHLPSYEFPLASYDVTPPGDDDELAWEFIRNTRTILLAARENGIVSSVNGPHVNNGLEEQFITPAEVHNEVFLTRAVSFIELCRMGGHVKLDLAFRHNGIFTEGWVYVRHMETSSRQTGLKVRASGAVILAKFTKKQRNDATLMARLDALMESMHVVLTHCLTEVCTVMPLTYCEEHWGLKKSSAGSELRLALERAEWLKRHRLENVSKVDDIDCNRKEEERENASDQGSCTETDISEDGHDPASEQIKPAAPAQTRFKRLTVVFHVACCFIRALIPIGRSRRSQLKFKSP
jgi:hypothetical protein